MKSSILPQNTKKEVLINNRQIFNLKFKSPILIIKKLNYLLTLIVKKIAFLANSFYKKYVYIDQFNKD